MSAELVDAARPVDGTRLPSAMSNSGPVSAMRHVPLAGATGRLLTRPTSIGAAVWPGEGSEEVGRADRTNRRSGDGCDPAAADHHAD